MPTKMDDPRELFLHELGDLLYAENALVKTLPKLAKEASDTELQEGFEAHLEETQQHVANLEQVFEAVGEKAKAEKCPAIDGITKEHDEFMSEEKPVARGRATSSSPAPARAPSTTRSPRTRA